MPPASILINRDVDGGRVKVISFKGDLIGHATSAELEAGEGNDTVQFSQSTGDVRLSEVARTQS